MKPVALQRDGLLSLGLQHELETTRKLYWRAALYWELTKLKFVFKNKANLSGLIETVKQIFVSVIALIIALI